MVKNPISLPPAFAALCLALAMPAVAELHRGVWFWNNTTLPDGSTSAYGSSIVVGDTAKEDETISFFTLRGVKRMYGSYQNRPVSEPAVIGAWNAKLDAAGISSQVLIDGVEVDDPADITSILDKVTGRLINFNAGVAVASRFDALHLDLEPQGSPAWTGATPAIKRGLLEDLLDAYTAIRNHLDTAGLTSMPMYADLPFTWDKLPAEGGSIGWADAADRDGWFTDIAGVLDGISLMTFSKDNFADIDAAISYERSGAFTGKARLGIQPKAGPGFLWPTILHFNSVMNDCESAYGPTGSTDLENYAFWRHSITTTQPSVGDPISVSIASELGGPILWGTGTGTVLVFDGLPGHLYIVRHGSSPGQIQQEIARVRTRTEADAEILKVPISANGPRRFWRVERIGDQ